MVINEQLENIKNEGEKRQKMGKGAAK